MLNSRTRSFCRLTAAGLACSAAGGVPAGLPAEVETVGYSINGFPPSSISIEMAPFDSADDRELAGVTLSFGQTLSAVLAAENTAATPAPSVGVQLVSLTTVTVGGQALSASDAAADFLPAPALAASDGVPGSGPDFFDFGQVGQTLDGDDAIMPAGKDSSAFSGPGPVVVDISLSVEFVEAGGPQIDWTVTDPTIEGWVTLTYFTSVIPGPASVAVAAIAAGAAWRRRR